MLDAIEAGQCVDRGQVLRFAVEAVLTASSSHLNHITAKLGKRASQLGSEPRRPPN
jgi:hypothetical protein